MCGKCDAVTAAHFAPSKETTNEPEWIYRVVFQSEGVEKDELFTTKAKRMAFINNGIEIDEACEIKVEWIACNKEFNTYENSPRSPDSKWSKG